MFRYFLILFIIIFVLSSQMLESAEFRSGLNWGYYGGRGWDAYGSAYNFAKGLPLAARLNIGYVTLNPGNANDARRIFINNDQGGTVQKKGSVIRLSFDFLYPIKIMNLPEVHIYAGPRFASFKGNFKFIGDNEDFDVTSSHWGFGLGLETGFPISKRLNFMVLTGMDYYASSTFYGHDTSYGPNGEKNNPREDYEYQDADQAINQPGFEPRLMIGLSYRLGK
jgi:hypothetical protein